MATVARFEPDLAANLQFADEFFDDAVPPIIDKFAERAGIDVRADDRAGRSTTRRS